MNFSISLLAAAEFVERLASMLGQPVEIVETVLWSSFSPPRWLWRCCT